MNELIPLQFDSADIRVVQDGGEPWFVGKDVCDALGYTNATKAMQDHCRGLTRRYPIQDAMGRSQETRVLSEGDVMRLIVKSTLPAAERFERWVFDEVLPTVRKTGSYTVPAKPRDQLRHLSAEFGGAIRIAKLAGLEGNQAVLAGAKATRTTYGVDPLVLIGSEHLVSPVQERHHTPTELGAEIGESAQKFNRRLESAGFQVKAIGGDWMPTDAGKKHSVLLDTGKKHSSGTPVTQLRWYDSVLDALRDAERGDAA